MNGNSLQGGDYKHASRKWPGGEKFKAKFEVLTAVAYMQE